MDKQCMKQLETLRGLMVDTANRKKTLLHTDVLTLSQLLDQMIVKVQTEKKAKRTKSRTDFVV
ncbi:aspartyl-phosphate phosphatase Spo0E family protein [Paenibacillus tarimensis]